MRAGQQDRIEAPDELHAGVDSPGDVPKLVRSFRSCRKKFHAEVVSEQHGRNQEPCFRHDILRDQQKLISAYPCRSAIPKKMTEFTSKIALLYRQIKSNLHQSRTLTVLRESLLFQLLDCKKSITFKLPVI